MATGSDDFDSLAAAAELNGRTASGGGTWTANTGFFAGATSGGLVTSVSASGRGAARLTTPDGTDGTVTATIFATTTAKTTLGLLMRYQDASNLLFGYWVGGTATWGIAKRSGGTDTRVDTDGSATNPPTTARTVTFQVSGVSPNIICTLKSDGTTVATATLNDTNLDPKGLVGIRNNFASTGNTVTLDNWSYADTASGAVLSPYYSAHYYPRVVQVC